MKHLLIIGLGIGLTTSLILGQGQITVGSGGNHWQRYWGWDLKQPPPLSLPEAYSLALTHIGSATNRFYCVGASCLDMTNYYFRGWSFSFSDTNGQKARVEVSYDKELRMDPQDEKLLRQ